ncbi:MAG: type II toxin-antitoxin system RelE/ParE family toxin [Opitutaceae bacterium]|jgi:plasmid stabilization system protein ParE|nr:type II toxin-antitoxin system RelE/ParE family toxin [Opitutaceae bacterium]
MKSKPVFELPEVERDLEEAIVHYESWHADGREHFLQKYEETVSWIEWNPDSFPKKYGRVQRAILKKSYYIVYFIQEENRSLILTVLDGRRNPDVIRRIVSRRRWAKR